jgi:hypothetical protein
VTITGDGFISSLTSVILHLSQYNALNGKITQITDTSLTLTTQSDQAGTFQLATYVNGVAAVCQIANCNFTFSSSFTPTLTSITPLTLSTPNTIFTISGTSFGTDSSKVSVTIGRVTCQVTSTIDTTIICTLPYLDLGSQNVAVLINGKSRRKKRIMLI